MITFPNAKINLGLNIVEKRPDGYHNLETIFYPIPLQDALEITPWEGGERKYKLAQSGIQIAGDDENNLVIKAYKLLDSLYNLPPIEINLLKHIPSGAGLGGGSADAAFMLCMLNQHFQLNIPNNQLEVYAAQLGADCAFFVENKPTFAEGIGNIFSPIELSLKGYKLLLVKPDIFVSTRDAFAQIKPKRPTISLKEVAKMPVEAWKTYMVNDFEESVFPQFPAIADIKAKLYDMGAIYASMSGSGSSVFALFKGDATLPKVDFGEGAFVFEAMINW
ncbi:MAG: 4-(cytidine 5'-diphospho)-2-C-methyl-D-erythritol kinase [Bacteroides sp.]|nr:4-(cytidine 5'-diphospho)-2-C-methyl-D-erythritol kinase [Bacteroides sp.]